MALFPYRNARSAALVMLFVVSPVRRALQHDYRLC